MQTATSAARSPRSVASVVHICVASGAASRSRVTKTAVDVAGVATTDGRETELVDAGIALADGSGVIGGVTGALLAGCHREGVPAAALVVRSNPYIPDPAAARAVIEGALEPLVEFDIDVRELREQAGRSASGNARSPSNSSSTNGRTRHSGPRRRWSSSRAPPPGPPAAGRDARRCLPGRRAVRLAVRRRVPDVSERYRPYHLGGTPAARMLAVDASPRTRQTTVDPDGGVASRSAARSDSAEGVRLAGRPAVGPDAGGANGRTESAPVGRG